jgi:thiamine pyrophosphate-dependent acetolactate synthase large subunit-like protein
MQYTLDDPRGPVHLDLSTQNARAQVCALTGSLDIFPQQKFADTTISTTDIVSLLSKSRRPVTPLGRHVSRPLKMAPTRYQAEAWERTFTKLRFEVVNFSESSPTKMDKPMGMR